MNANYFPWRLFKKYFFSVFILLNLAFLLSLALASFVFDFEFYSVKTFVLFGSFVAFSLLGSGFFAYQLALPMRDLVLKTLRISSAKYVAEFEESEVLLQSAGPFVELEQALEKIRRKLQRRRLQLSHEREELQALMGAMDDAVMSVALDEKVVFYNAKFAAQFLPTDSDSSLSPSPNLAACFRQPNIRQIFQAALIAGKTSSAQIQLHSRLTGMEMYYSVRVSPLREEKSLQIYGALGVFHDISELKKAEKIRIEFVENASHELRTPLTAIKGYLATLRDDFNSGHLDQVPQFLSIVMRNVDRLTELVGDMLTISTLESSPGLRFEKINPLFVSEEIASRLGAVASEKNISIQVRSEMSEISVDVSKIEQVLINLIGNAIKYIPEHGKVEVEWKKISSQHFALSVRDNGPGISIEHQSRLFERFYRIDKGRSRDVGGTGLGLSIVKHIVQSHGGQVRVQSEFGHGAEFVCEFPSRI